MNTSFRFLFLVILIPVIFLLVIIFNIFTRDETCGVTLINQMPLHNEIVFLYERGCGATTGIELHLSLMPKGSELENSFGNLFSASIDSVSLTINENVFLEINSEGNIVLSIKSGILKNVHKQDDRVLIKHI